MLHWPTHDVVDLDVHVEIAVLAKVSQGDASLLVKRIGIVANLREEKVIVDDKPKAGFRGVVLRIPHLEVELVCTWFKIAEWQGDTSTSEVVQRWLIAVVQHQMVASSEVAVHDDVAT